MFSSTSFSTLRRAKDDRSSWFKEFLRYDFTLFRVENDRSPDALLIGIDKYIRSKDPTDSYRVEFGFRIVRNELIINNNK